jgi:hypothetical protein
MWGLHFSTPPPTVQKLAPPSVPLLLWHLCQADAFETLGSEDKGVRIRVEGLEIAFLGFRVEVLGLWIIQHVPVALSVQGAKIAI